MNASPPIPEPGEPEAPDTETAEAASRDTATPRHREEIDHDDLIGFASPAALEGRLREVPSSVVEEVAEPVVTPPVVEPILAAPVTPAFASRPVAPVAPVVPDWARETPLSEQPADSFGRRREQPEPVDGAMSLYTVYALILFAVPTLGVSAVIALFSVMTSEPPAGAVASSHFTFQKRTLLIGAAVALIGGVLIAVGLGVFVLFALALWLIVRGAGGVLQLKSGRPIANPGTLLL